jgi:hypothetical protein
LDTLFSPTDPSFVFLFFPTRKKIEVFNANTHCTHLSLPANAQADPNAKPKECNRQRFINTEQPSQQTLQAIFSTFRNMF